MWMFIIWAWQNQNDTFVKVLMSVTLFAASCSHLSLLSLARLEKRFMWSRYAVYAAVWSLAALLLFLIWNTRLHDEEIVGRVIGVLSILIGALTVITPIFHKLSSGETKSEQIDTEIAGLRARISELELKKTEIDVNDEVARPPDS
jgi:RsiW-degrading membrane proteinase PrsW (M82 family)